MCTWGLPTPEVHLDGKPDKGVTKVRKTFIPHWQQWLGVGNRCLVLATAFSECEQIADPDTGKKPLRCFVVNEGQPLFRFAGIYTRWEGARGPIKAPREGEHDLNAFLTTDPNEIVKPIHPKAMPVLLTTREEWEIWMTASLEGSKGCSTSPTRGSNDSPSALHSRRRSRWQPSLDGGSVQRLNCDDDRQGGISR
jgi:putative SOS response-associated peptidase YedK